MIGIGIRIGCPLPDTLKKRNRLSRAAQPVERKPSHLNRLDIRRILGHGFGKGLLRIDQFPGPVVGDALSTAGSRWIARRRGGRSTLPKAQETGQPHQGEAQRSSHNAP